MEEQGWAPTLAAVREQRRRFEAGEVHEDADAPVDVPDRRNELVLVGVIASSLTALWGGGVVGLVTRPDAALGTGPFLVGLFPRAAAIWMVLITATVAGCLAVLVSVRARTMRAGAVTAALAVTLLTMGLALLRLFPLQMPVGEHTVGNGQTLLQTGPDALTRFLPVVSAGALSAVFAALVLVRDRRPRSMVTVAAVGVAWVVAGSGVTRAPRLTEKAGRAGTDVWGDPDLSIAMLVGGVLLVTLALVLVLRMPSRRRGRTWARRWIVVAEVASVTGAILALAWPTHHVGSWIAGRPLRRHRRQVVPAIQMTNDGTTDDTRTAGARWLRCAAEEKASITVFEDLAVHLNRLGAPTELAARARAAARDEEHHTVACLTVAALLGQRGTIGDLPRPRPWVDRAIPRRLCHAHLQVLVRESIVDGMLGEGLAAERLQVGGANATSSEIRAICARLAEDERSHAALATDVVRWSASVDPRGTRRQIRWARRRIPGDAHDTDVGPLTADRDRNAGFVDEIQGRQCWRAVRRRVLDALEDIDHDLIRS